MPTANFSLDEISIQSCSRTVSYMIDLVKIRDQIDFPPCYWDVARQSLLIESIVMGIPLPSFYLYENERKLAFIETSIPQHEILNALVRFSYGIFPLSEVHPELNGKRFRELPPKYKTRLENSRILTHVVEYQVPHHMRPLIEERVKY